VELQQQAEGFRKKGLAVASLTYDSVAILKDFAERKKVTYPMLSDPESKVIKAFGILNTNMEPGNMAYGVPFPGMYIVDARGLVKAKYFEDDHRERYTAADVLTRD
jgi:peroxiredoxin